MKRTIALRMMGGGACLGESIRALSRALGRMPQDIFSPEFVWLHAVPALGYAWAASIIIFMGTKK